MVFLLYEEIRVYMDKPTDTEIIKKALIAQNVPDMALCIEPGFDIQALRQYGYEDSWQIIYILSGVTNINC